MRYCRSRLEIAYNILTVIGKSKDGEIPTHILFKANLSKKILDKYLRVLNKDEFIKTKILENRTRYFVTKKGINFLYLLRRVDEMTRLITLSSTGKREFTEFT